jgi:hypothetical protein
MYNYMLLEMAEAISAKCGARSEDAMRAKQLFHQALIDYWQDKIAHVWQVDDMFETARRAGKPITHADAIELLKNVFDSHDSDIGITWMTLDAALEDYQLDFANLPAENCSQVHGVFKVWREHDPIAHQFGILPKQVAGNLPAALDFARSLAQEKPGLAVFIGCEANNGMEAKPWLIIQSDNDQITIKESEA